MKNFLIVFSVFVAWSFFALWLYSWLEPQNEKAIAEKTINSKAEIAEINNETLLLDFKDDIIVEDTVPTPSLLTENNDENLPFKRLRAIDKNGIEIFTFNEGIKIYKNSAIISIAQNNQGFVNALKKYMDKNQDLELHINVLYSPIENFDTPNLGMQRGKKIKTLLEAVTIPSENIVIKPTIQEVNFNADGSYPNGVYFTFKDFDPNRKIDIVSENGIPEKIIMYPNYSESGILVNKQLRDASETVRTVLKENINLKAIVVGHTDNVGNANDNYQTGLGYARQIRWYLLRQGEVGNNRIRAISQGESQSIATNGTEKGRLLNKRIEVIFEPIN